MFDKKPDAGFPENKIPDAEFPKSTTPDAEFPKSKIKDAFDAVHADEDTKRRTMELLKKTRPAPRRALRLAVAAACLLLALAGAGAVYLTPVRAVSLDINPSLELGINRFDRVVSQTGYNEEGSEVCAQTGVLLMDYTDAVGALLEGSELRGYIEQGAEVLITVMGETQEKSEEMRLRISSCKFAEGAHCMGASPGQAQEAHAAGLSLGKYRVFKEISALDPGFSADEAQKMSMKQLRQRLAQLSGTDEQGESGKGENCGKGNGGGGNCGKGNGSGGNCGNAKGSSGSGGNAKDSSGSGGNAKDSGSGGNAKGNSCKGKGKGGCK